MEHIQRLCREYTNLNDEDIKIICDLSKLLQPLADIDEADIFIDCPIDGGDAIVVAEANPIKVPSSYKKSVVGMLAKQENEPAVARTFRLKEGTRQMKALTQENCHTIQTVEPIFNESRIIGVLIREKRVDEEQQINERLHLSQKGYEKIASFLENLKPEDNWLTECIDEALIIVNKEGIITFRNILAKKLYESLGYVEDILGQPYGNVRLSNEVDKDKNYTITQEVIGGANREVRVGSHVVDIKTVSLNVPDASFSVLMKDITAQKQQEKALILKSVAIKEMHHRVKNNLQIIASLLRLQMRRTDSDEASKALGESINRILSIAGTHQLLAQAGTDEVYLQEIIIGIKNNTQRYYASPANDIKISIEGDNFKVDSDIATSVALIINELLQNAFEYAFPERDKGNIRIIIIHGELYSRIQVIDDGIGFDPENIDTSHMGISIVKSLVQDKLQGVIKINSDEKGTVTDFEFKNKIMDR